MGVLTESEAARGPVEKEPEGVSFCGKAKESH